MINVISCSIEIKLEKKIVIVMELKESHYLLGENNNNRL